MLGFNLDIGLEMWTNFLELLYVNILFALNLKHMLKFNPNIGPEMWASFLELPYVNPPFVVK